MATVDEIADLRRKTGEPTTATYSDELLSDVINELGDLNLAAATIWNEKAARYAELVTVSESGSSRSMSDLHKHCLAMAERFQSLYTQSQAEEDSSTVRVKTIERA